MRAFMVLLLVSGCYQGAFEHRPGQDLAERVVWYGAYGMKAAPPEVEWVPVERLSAGCSGRTLLGWKLQVSCGASAIARPDGDACGYPIWQTLYAHELMHWRCYEETGDVDAAHRHCDWSEVDEANLELMESDGTSR